MVEKLQDEADIIVGLDINSIGTGFPHRMGSQVVDTEQVAGLVHNFVELLFGDVSIVMSGRWEEPS